MPSLLRSLLVRVIIRGEGTVQRIRDLMPLNWLLFASVFLLSGLSIWLAYEVRFDFDVPQDSMDRRTWMMLFAASFKTVLFYFMGMHTLSWRYLSLKDSPWFLMYAVTAAVALYVASISFDHLRTPRSVILIDSVLTLVLVAGSRYALRMAREIVKNTQTGSTQQKERRVAIIGAGDAGEMLCREMLRNRVTRFRPVAFFDDDEMKRGVRIHGVRIVGPIDAFPAFAALHEVHEAVIAIPSLNREAFQRIYGILKPTGVSIKTLPPLSEMLNRAPALNQIRDIQISDLLGREEIKVNTGQVRAFLQDKTVLVTGAGGSIGSELCRQILQRSPRKLVLVERSENGLFHIHRELVALRAGVRVDSVLLDITDAPGTLKVFNEHKPDLVFHAAAHKHVPLQETHPCECFRNNVGGTISVARAADVAGVEKFIMISTDKAVNPTSVMGATKRVCELYCQSLADKSATEFVSVRFGNVLASEGSVVPIFMRQIAEGGPVTVTHPDMKRYFMTIPEAVTLVLQAAVLGTSGQVMFLDMGTPVRIVDLVQRLLELSGRGPDEIPIEFIGLRPGEKLFEELVCTDETCVATPHEKVKVLKGNWNGSGNGYKERIEESLNVVSRVGDPVFTRAVLKSLVPEYSFNGNGD